MPVRSARPRLCKEPVKLVIDFRPKAAVHNHKGSGKTSTSEIVDANPSHVEQVSDCSTSSSEETIVCDIQPAGTSQSAASVISETGESVTPEVQVIKRKRGRPRKNPESVVTSKKLKFSVTTGTADGSAGESGFPVTPYPGKTGSTGRVPRPPNAFMIYGKENRRRLSAEYPGSTNKEISKLLGEKWQSLDDSVKSEYRESAKKALQEHRNKYPDYQYIPTEARIRKQRKAAEKAFADLSRSTSKPVTKIQTVVADVCDDSEANKENIPPPLPQMQIHVPEPSRIITELFVAPPGYEDVEIEGLDKFVLWENKLIPYREWLGAEGDVKRLSGNYTQVPEQLLQPITNCVIAGTHLETASSGEFGRGHEGQRDSGEVVNTIVWNQSDEQMTLNECNSCPSSEADKQATEVEKSGSEMDAQRLLHDLMTGDVRSNTGTAAVVVQEQPLSAPSRRLFWTESSVTSDDE